MEIFTEFVLKNNLNPESDNTLYVKFLYFYPTEWKYSQNLDKRLKSQIEIFANLRVGEIDYVNYHLWKLFKKPMKAEFQLSAFANSEIAKF